MDKALIIFVAALAIVGFAFIWVAVNIMVTDSFVLPGAYCLISIGITWCYIMHIQRDIGKKIDEVSRKENNK